MRRFVLALAAAVTVAGAGAVMTTGANAMTLNGSGLGAAVKENSATEPVAYVCRRFWNGYYWVRRCYHTGPRVYYAPRVYRPHRRVYRYY